MKAQRLYGKRSGSASPIWIVAMLVTVSTLGWVHRFQQKSGEQQTDYSLFSMKDLADTVVVGSDDELEPEPQRRTMLRESREEDDGRVQLQAEVENAKAEAEFFRQEVERLKQQLMELTTKEGSLPQSTTAAKESKQVVPVTAVQDRRVYWLPPSQLEQNDAFSASWLQKTEDFLTMELHSIQICEDAAFRAYKGARRAKLRMSLDWLDFSIEHLSKWWKMLQIFRQKEVYQTAIQRFDQYLSNAASYPLEKDLSFQDTIAVIAYQPYRDDKEPLQAYTLTVKSLAATVESLRRAGFGRVVVVGDSPNDPKLTQDTFRQLKQFVEHDVLLDEQTIVTQVGHMQVAYTPFNMKDALTNHIQKNVPRATLFGLKHAFDVGKQKKEERTARDQAHLERWLGDREWYSYVYLTEPDSILQTRPGTLKQLKEEVDKGMVLVPHRLQPIPHESDARGSSRDFLYLPEDDFPVMELDAIGGNDSCCDAHQGPKYKPGAPPMFESCGNFWYMCDFSRRKTREQRTHDRVKKYDLIRLKQGTGIVSLSSLEHGRPCHPKKNHVCLPPEK